MNNSFSSLSIMKDGSLVDETAEQELSVRTHQALINLGKALHEHPSDSETQVQKCLAEAQTVLRRVDTSRRQAQKLLRISHKKSCDLLREKTVSQSFANDCRSQLLQTQQKLRDVHQRCDQYEKAFETTTVELMKLRRFVRALPSNYVACGMAYLENDPSEEFGEMPQMTGAGAQQLVPDRRFEEAFRDKMRGIYFHRRYRHARRLHEESCRRYEEMCMELEDGGISCGLGSRLSITPASAPPTEEAKATSPLAAQSQFPLLMDIPCKISFSSTTPDDDVLKSLIYHSNFGDVLSDSRDGLLQLSNRMKSAQDTAVRNLYEVFMSALRTIAAVFDDEGGKVKKYLQKSFETQVVKMQGAHRDNLISLVRQTNDTTRNIVRVEKLLLASGKLPAVVAVPATVAAENGGVASQPATPRPASPRGSKHLDELLHIHRELQMKSEANSVKLNITHENAAALLGHLKRVTDTISELKVSGAVAKSAWPFTSAEEAAVDLPGLGNRMSAAVDLVVASMRHAFRSMDDGSLSLSASIRPHSPKRGRKGSTGRPKLVASPPRRKSQAAASPTAGGPPRDKQRLSGAPPLKLRELSLSASTSMGATTDALMTEDSVTELMPGDVVMHSAEEHSTEQEPLTPDEILLNDSTNNLTAPRRKKADRRVRSNSLQAHKVFQPSWRHALSPTKLRRGSDRDGGIPRPPPPLPPATVTTGVLSSEASLPSSWSCSPSFSSIPSFFSLPTAVRNRSVPTHVPTASEPRTPVGIVGVSLSVDRSR